MRLAVGMNITRETEGNVTVLRISDAIVDGSLEVLEDAIQECFEMDRLKIILEVTSVPFIDSVGLEKLQEITMTVGKHAGNAVVSGLNDVCRDIFMATRMDSLIPTTKTCEEAIENFS